MAEIVWRKICSLRRKQQEATISSEKQIINDLVWFGVTFASGRVKGRASMCAFKWMNESSSIIIHNYRFSRLYEIIKLMIYLDVFLLKMYKIVADG